MELALLLLSCIAGLVLLVAGGEFLTLGSSRIAAMFGVRPIIIGLTIVAFGTSMPEAFVSIFASLENKPDIAVANVVGSNIFNIAFILGMAAIVHPLKVEAGSLRREVPFVIGSACLVWVLSLDRVLSRVDGAILLTVFFIFLWACFRDVQKKDPDSERAEDHALAGKKRQFLLILASLLLLAGGARLLILGSSGIARMMGVSELLIGLTIVAAGTSLPELATSVLASFRGKDDIAVGNVTGSNIFNILFILGLSALALPLSVNETLFARDIPLMVLVSLVALPILKSGFVISRLEGAALLAVYVVYICFLLRAG